jgi:riboflavin kinase/FMN adenylyltransferase
MDVVRGFPQRAKTLGGVLALGTFDGVHRGHQALLGEAVRRASDRGTAAAVMTFDPHPLQVIAPPPEPFLLTTLDERLELLAASGLAAAYVIPFDAALRALSAEEWVDLLWDRIGMTEVISGANYTFGRDRGGTVSLLRALAGARGFSVHVPPQVHVGGTLVSSTLIRRLVRSGDVAEAGRFLGRWYALGGVVGRGDARGRTLGFPTANLTIPDEKLIPAAGIYAALAAAETGAYEAAVSIGTRPTYGPGALTVEAHLLDFAGDLYGQSLRIAFVQRLREEIAFTSEAALVRQIGEDVAETRRLLPRARPPEAAS